MKEYLATIRVPLRAWEVDVVAVFHDKMNDLFFLLQVIHM